MMTIVIMQRRKGCRYVDTLELLTVDDLAGLLKVKKSWIYDQVERGDLPALKLGAHVRFQRQRIEAYLAARQMTAGSYTMSPCTDEVLGGGSGASDGQTCEKGA